MNAKRPDSRMLAVLALPLLLLGCSGEAPTGSAAAEPAAAAAAAPTDDCPPFGDFAYVCGPQSAEDLVRVPGTDWIISSGFGTGSPFYRINAVDKTFSTLVPTVGVDTSATASCPGAPDLGALVSHGLAINTDADGHSTLYVVGHGGREAIEFFDVGASSGSPTLTWRDCVALPDGMAANSVAALADGRLLMTVPLRPGRTMSEAMAGALTGGVYGWAPGDPGIEAIAGTDLPYANGIEVSADGETFYVASSGASTVTAYSNGNPAQVLRTSEPLAIVPDNLHAGPDGGLITAGLLAESAQCGAIDRSGSFDLEAFASCPRPYQVLSLDPQSLAVEILASGPADARFSNVTMALPIDGELWVGTFAGDRVAYRVR